MFMNSRIPNIASSRPWPERFTPPKGSRGSDATMRLMKTIPDSRPLMNFSRSPGSLVHALAPRPNGLEFAIRMASSTFLARHNEATGPKSPPRRGWGFLGKFGEHRREVKIPRPTQPFPAGQQSRSRLNCFLHVGVEFLQRVRGRQRSDVGILVKGSSHLQRLHFFHEQALEFVRDFFRDNK